MSDQTVQWREIIERKTIVKKAFYVRAEKSNYYPEGILKLYRRTRAQNAFTYQAVRIRNPEEFAQVKLTLDWLAGRLNWQELPSILEDLKKQLEKEQEETSPEILRLIRQYPTFATSIVKTFDKVYHGHIEIEDLPTINKFIQTTFSSLTGQAKNILETKIELFNKLNEETQPEEIQKMTSLLEMYSLPQLTSVTSIITDRLQKIRLLEATIQNERAYEFKGKDSVHNQLTNALWILNDAYWLLSSNEPLKNLLDSKSNLSQEDAGLKPDFIFANDKHTIVIVEVKRPSHQVTQKDINQLQNYLVAVDDYAPDFTSKQGFLIAQSISPHYQKIISETTQLIEAKSYVQLIDECKRRYQEYLEAIEKLKAN